MQVASSIILAPDTSFRLHPVLTSFDILRAVLLFTQVLLSVMVRLERRVYPWTIILYSLESPAHLGTPEIRAVS